MNVPTPAPDFAGRRFLPRKIFLFIYLLIGSLQAIRAFSSSFRFSLSSFISRDYVSSIVVPRKLVLGAISLAISFLPFLRSRFSPLVFSLNTRLVHSSLEPPTNRTTFLLLYKTHLIRSYFPFLDRTLGHVFSLVSSSRIFRTFNPSPFVVVVHVAQTREKTGLA